VVKEVRGEAGEGAPVGERGLQVAGEGVPMGERGARAASEGVRWASVCSYSRPPDSLARRAAHQQSLARPAAR
jgi:hypothetical protein